MESANSRQLPTRENEGSFLKLQSDMAAVAVKQTLHDMNETLMKVVNARSCVRQHPWLVVGSAVTAGFIAGAAVTRSPEETDGSSDSDSMPDRIREAVIAKRSFLLSHVGSAVTGIMKIVMQGLLAAAVVAREPPPQREGTLADTAELESDSN